MSQSGIPVVEDIAGGLSDIGSDIDDFINDEIPGGWGTVAALAGAAYYGGLPSFSGTSAASNAATLAAEEAAFYAADAAQLAGQGLSAAQIESTLAYTGANPLVAADAAQLAAQGLSENAIAQNLVQSNAPVSGGAGGLTTKQALDAAKQAKNLLSSGQQQPTTPSGIPQLGSPQAARMAGAVSYEPLISLLTSGRAKTPGISSLLG